MIFREVQLLLKSDASARATRYQGCFGLVGLYSVAVHESRVRALGAAVVLEWRRTSGSRPEPSRRSLALLTATAAAALCIGLTVRSGRNGPPRREVEHDQQASIAAAEERTRIAREMHDIVIVAHSLSVVVTLTDAGSVVIRSDPDRATEAMRQASAVGRQALGDMRAMIGVLRTDAVEAVDLVPQPGLAQLDALVERVGATGLDAVIERVGASFPLGPTD